VFESAATFFRSIDRRIRVLFVFLGIHLWHRDLPAQYNQLYATALGANPVELGSLDSVGSIASSLISVPSGLIADRFGAKKVILIGLAMSALVSALYSLASSWWILIPAIILYGVCQRLVMPYVDVLFINYSKPQQRSMVMSLSRTLWAIPRLVTSVVAAIIVTYFGGVNAEGIRPLYFIQLVLGTFVFLAIAIWLAPATNSNEHNARIQRNRSDHGGVIADFREVFAGEPWLKRWLVIMILRNVGMRLAMPFTPLWIVDVKGADPYILGLMGLGNTLVGLLLQLPVGRLADRIGRKRAFYLFRPFVYIGTLLLVFTPKPEYLIIVGMLGYIGLVGGGGGGGLGGVSFVPLITMNFELVSEEKRGRWLGLLGFCGIVSFPISIIGGFMWYQGLMMEVLLLPIVLDVIAILMMRTIPDTVVRSA
jgi:MFS family permease